MTNQELLRRYQAGGGRLAAANAEGAAVAPALHTAVVTCMDSRIDVFALFGLAMGEVHVLRNAGGVVTDDVVRSLTISQRKLATREVLLVQHTGCGLATFTDDEFSEELAEDVGMRPPWRTHAFASPAVSVRRGTWPSCATTRSCGPTPWSGASCWTSRSSPWTRSSPTAEQRASVAATRAGELIFDAVGSRAGRSSYVRNVRQRRRNRAVPDVRGHRPRRRAARRRPLPAWVADVDGRGKRLIGDRMRPAADATTVRVRKGELLVTDGPFIESKDWIAGFDVLECDDLDEAIEIASRHPMARAGRLELRPFWPFEE